MFYLCVHYCEEYSFEQLAWGLQLTCHELQQLVVHGLLCCLFLFFLHLTQIIFNVSFILFSAFVRGKLRTNLIPASFVQVRIVVPMLILGGIEFWFVYDYLTVIFLASGGSRWQTPVYRKPLAIHKRFNNCLSLFLHCLARLPLWYKSPVSVFLIYPFSIHCLHRLSA